MSLLDHLSRCGLRAEEKSLYVDCEHLVKRCSVQFVLRLLSLDVYQKSGKVDARVVDDRVDVAVLVKDLSHHCLYALGIRDVALYLVGAVHDLAGPGVHVDYYRVCSRCHQCACDVLSDAGSAACDCYYFALKI